MKCCFWMTTNFVLITLRFISYVIPSQAFHGSNEIHFSLMKIPSHQKTSFMNNKQKPTSSSTSYAIFTKFYQFLCAKPLRTNTKSHLKTVSSWMSLQTVILKPAKELGVDHRDPKDFVNQYHLTGIGILAHLNEVLRQMKMMKTLH